jgi:hypothetical protein
MGLCPWAEKPQRRPRRLHRQRFRYEMPRRQHRAGDGGVARCLPQLERREQRVHDTTNATAGPALTGRARHGLPPQSVITEIFWAAARARASALAPLASATAMRR